MARAEDMVNEVCNQQSGIAILSDLQPWTVVGHYVESKQVWCEHVYSDTVSNSFGVAIRMLLLKNRWDRSRIDDLIITNAFPGFFMNHSVSSYEITGSDFVKDEIRPGGDRTLP